MHLAVMPVLFALGAGKLTMVLGGAGQGRPSDATWATAYLGPGPWSSLAPALPSVPSQILEGAVTLLIAIVIGLVLTLGAFGSRDGRALFVGLAAWAVGRAVVAMTWRDPAVVGPLGMGSIIALGVAIGCAAVAIGMTVRRRRNPVRGRGRAAGRQHRRGAALAGRPRPVPALILAAGPARCGTCSLATAAGGEGVS